MDKIIWENDGVEYIANQVRKMILNFKQKNPEWMDTNAMEVILNKYKHLIMYNACEEGIILEGFEIPVLLQGKDANTNEEVFFVAIFNHQKLQKLYKKEANKYVILFNLSPESDINYLTASNNRIINGSIIDYSLFKNFEGCRLEDLWSLMTGIRITNGSRTQSKFKIFISHSDCEKLFTIGIGFDDIILYNSWGDYAVYKSPSIEILTKDILEDMLNNMLLWEKNKVHCANCGKIIEIKKIKGKIFAGAYCDDCTNTEKFKGMKTLSML